MGAALGGLPSTGVGLSSFHKVVSALVRMPRRAPARENDNRTDDDFAAVTSDRISTIQRDAGAAQRFAARVAVGAVAVVIGRIPGAIPVSVLPCLGVPAGACAGVFPHP